MDSVKWVRAHEIAEFKDDEGPLQIFKVDKSDDKGRKVTPSDIKQGGVGNCYFLSALSVMAENQNRILEMFITDKANDECVWSIRMYKNGVCYEINMDNFIPCKNGRPCFATANGNELWVIILEKAWAKIHKSYERTSGGFPHLAMRDMTGAPSFSKPIDEVKPDELR
jgi:calpain-15